MTRVPFGVRVISSIYGLKAVACLVLSAVLLLALCFDGDSGFMSIPLLPIALLVTLVGMVQGALSVGLWKGNRLALFAVIGLTLISAVSGVAAVLTDLAENMLDPGICVFVAFDVGAAGYLILSPEVRKAFD